MKITKFFNEVKSEMRNVVWPTSKEAAIVSGVVAVVVVISSLFFLLADYVIFGLIKLFWTFKGW